MTELDIFKSIKKYSKLSLIFSILIIVFFIVFIVALPWIGVGINSLWNPQDNYVNEKTGQLVLVIFWIWFFISILLSCFAILVIIFNIISIVKSSSLAKSKDKNLCIAMAILSIFLLGVISNAILIVVSNRNIKQLSLEEQTIIEESARPIGPSVY